MLVFGELFANKVPVNKEADEYVSNYNNNNNKSASASASASIASPLIKVTPPNAHRARFISFMYYPSDHIIIPTQLSVNSVFEVPLYGRWQV